MSFSVKTKIDKEYKEVKYWIQFFYRLLFQELGSLC